MPLKITKEKFIEALENNEDNLSSVELAATLEISISYFYKLRTEYKEDIKNKAKELSEKLAIEQVQNLQRNALKGDTKASQLLLEMATVYIPSSKQNVNVKGEIDNKIEITVQEITGDEEIIPDNSDNNNHVI